MLPPFLQSGDVISIISPSGAIDNAYIDNATNTLIKWGFQVKEMPHARGKYGRFSGTIEERTADLQAAIDDPNTKAILCSRGGYGLVQIIDQIDFSNFEINPKWIIGFSDITVLHSICSAINVPSIHSIMAKHLSLPEAETEPALRLHDLLFGKLPIYNISGHPLNREGEIKGKLIGGNLSVLYGLRGTYLDFSIFNEKNILFIEDVGERPYQIDRMIHNLKLGGILENISGLIVGQFSDYEEDAEMGKTVYELIADAVAEYDYPVCFNFPAGHVEKNLPLVMNGMAELTISSEKVTLNFNCRQ